MSQNFLQLNTGKTELMIIGSKRDREEFEDVSLWLDGLAIPQSASVKNLGVLFDPQLCFDQHIRSITRIAGLLQCTVLGITELYHKKSTAGTQCGS